MYYHFYVSLLFLLLLPHVRALGVGQCNVTSCPITYFQQPPTAKDNAPYRFYIGNMYNNADDGNSMTKWAIVNINNDTSFLPDVKIELYSLYFSTAPQAVIGATKMVGMGIQTIIANADDDYASPLHDICMAYNVPLYAIRAMDDAFAQKKTYTVLTRTFPVSSSLTLAMATLLRSLSYTGALLITTLDSHETESATTMAQQANMLGMPNVFIVNVPTYPGPADLALMVNQSKTLIAEYSLRPIVMLTTTATGGAVQQALYDAGVYGPDNFYMYSTDMSRSNLGVAFPKVTAPISTGSFNIFPRDGCGTNFPTILKQWALLNRTMYPGSSPTASTQWFAYDTPYVVAYALDLATQRKPYPSVTFQDILAATYNVSFMGVSGPVAFDENRDIQAHNGHYFYQVMNWLGYKYSIAALYNFNGTITQYAPYVFYNLSTVAPNPGYCKYCFHGQCNAESVCVCDPGWEGSYCESPINNSITLYWVLPIVGVIVILSLIAVFYFKRRREQLIKDLAMRQRSDIARNEIKLLDRIGRGASGAVYKALFRGTEVAAKSLLTTNTSSDTLEEFKMETAIMCALRHPNIVLFMGSCFDVQQREMLLVMEFCSRGSLHDLLNDPKVVLSYELLLHLACQSAQGMNFLHESSPPIIHRDLKSHNILLDDKFTAKISDFGLTRFKDTNKKSATARAESLGTVFWTAPEVLSGKVHTEKSDCYSFGIVLWEMFHRQDPYPMMDLVTVAMDVMNKGIRPVMSPSTPQEIQDLIRDCWQQDPERRPSFQSITNRLRALSMQHPMHTFATGHQSRIEAPTGVVYLVHSDIPALHTLFDAMPRVTKQALILHNHLVRTNLELYGGFEVRMKSKGFFVVFNNCASAVNWCIATQVALTHLSWPEELLRHAEASEVVEGGAVIWRGLRVRMSISMGQPEVDMDSNTGRMTYFGPVANKAKSILRLVKEGSVLADGGVMEQVNNKKLPLIETVVSKVSDDVLADGEILHEILPSTLANRQGHYITAGAMEVASMDEQADQTVVTFAKDPYARPAWIIPFKQLTIAESIGKGQVGDYYRALWGGGNREVAVKILVNQKLREDDFISLLADVSMLSRIKHKFLLPVHGVCTKRGNISIIVDCINNGSLKDLLARKDVPISTRQMLQMAHDIASGMLYLTTHAHPELHIHDNFKSNNILVTTDFEIKITDFGQTNIKDLARTMTSISSVAWTAPEILNGDPITIQSAVYSFGIILWELCSRKIPYDGEHPLKVVTKIMNGFRPSVPECSPEFQTLMRSCWDEDPAQRPTWHVIVSELSHMLSNVQ